MKKKLLKILAFGFTGAVLISCSSENLDEQMTILDSTSETGETATYTREDLAGSWKLYSMTSNASSPVDLNNDGTSSNDLLTETTCFKDVSFTFSLGGSISTQQAKLYFETATGAMECKSKVYEATYEVEGDQLEITFTYDGGIKQEYRTIAITESNGQEFLHLALQDYEVQTYLPAPEDRQTSTGAENVERIELIYARQ